jgi:hypothetical protein
MEVVKVGHLVVDIQLLLGGSLPRVIEPEIIKELIN